MDGNRHQLWVEDESASSSSTLSTSAIQNYVEQLKMNWCRDSTKKNYYAVWRTFNEFFIKLDEKPNSWEERLILFVGFLVSKNRRSSTIRSYISAIKAVLLNDGVELCQNKYLITCLTRACKLKNDRVTKRFPIQKGLLSIIIENITKIFCDQPYLQILYQCLITTAYFGLFRVGELAESQHAVKARDVHIAKNKRKMRFILRTSKTHGLDKKPQIIKISSEAIRSIEKYPRNINCPFELLRKYVEIRKLCASQNENFFIFRDRAPVRVANVRSVLKEAISLAGLDMNNYNTHSLRAGRSVDLVYKMKLPVSVVQKLGRWTSNAVYKYLKI